MSKRYGTLEARFWRHVNPEPNTGCWLWDGPIDDFGYGRFRVGQKKRRARRISADLHSIEVPAGKILRHKCDVPGCVNPDHLLVGTHAENNRDRSVRGRSCSGEASPFAKLSIESVRAIRAANGTHRALAAQFGVSHAVIGKIRRGQKWAAYA